MKKIGSWAALFLGGIVGVGAMMAATRIFNPADDKKDNKEEQKQEEQLPEGTPYTLATFQDSTLYTMRPATTGTKVAGKWFRIFFENHNGICVHFTGQSLTWEDGVDAFFSGSTIAGYQGGEKIDVTCAWSQVKLGGEDYIDVCYDFEYANVYATGPSGDPALSDREDQDALTTYLDIYIPTKNVDIFNYDTKEKVGEFIFNSTTCFESVDSEYNYVIYELIPN